jgi:hypothetical protein
MLKGYRKVLVLFKNRPDINLVAAKVIPTYRYYGISNTLATITGAIFLHFIEHLFRQDSYQKQAQFLKVLHFQHKK